jgi:hypothetical protein
MAWKRVKPVKELNHNDFLRDAILSQLYTENPNQQIAWYVVLINDIHLT